MATKSIFALLSYLIVMCCLLVGCISKCPNKSYFSAETRSYFLDFKPGSYWIYKNVVNGDIDSVYFVSQQIFGNDPTLVDNCPQEFAEVSYNGFANLPFSYEVNSWGGEFKASGRYSGMGFLSQSSFGNKNDFIAQGIKYSQVITLIDCCITGCYAYCPIKTFQFDRLYFAPGRGIIRWEASNHPQFGKVVYELIRTNIK
jgi:hypothetical protein